MTRPFTVSEVIEKLTPSVLEGALGVSAQAISNMKQRDAIPPRHWPSVAALALDNPDLKNLTITDLVRMHTIGHKGGAVEHEGKPKPRRNPYQRGSAAQNNAGAKSRQVAGL